MQETIEFAIWEGTLNSFRVQREPAYNDSLAESIAAVKRIIYIKSI